ncbi:glycosyltransferase family 4 protein [Neolewinella antarctica]|uniref:Glycosyltransferase involved in cell wall biosynthesis n=1 Tax=Neolewinella antarctica TaxID=442734 RepID=A0ABX0XA68_9BACT|nr:glycosyltransferase family 4 protein [Neolewinella antarctica]NJC26125.1 glycosyltransferase involved in cell wall biosynthesis [Neolewinella antarctica]
MNILLIHQYFLEKDDGGGSRMNEMTRVWEEKGHTTTVLAGMVHYATGVKRDRYKGKFTVIDPHGPGTTVIRSHVSEAYNVNFLGRLWAYFSFVFSSIYAGLFKTEGKFDVILVTSPPLFVGITAYLLSRLKGIPFVFEVRDLWPESAIDTGVLQNKLIINLAFWFENFVYRNATLINVLTPAFRDKLINEKGVAPEKVVFIPNAADFTLSDPLLATFDRDAFRQRHGWADKTVATYVGAHGVANHLIQVVEAAELLSDRPDIHFVLIGGGMRKEDLKAAVTGRGLTNVEFVDSVPKSVVFEYILASDYGMSVLKKVDTFKTIYSNKTFDYMATKRPVLLAIDGVSRELVETADCGFYIEPEDPVDFARVLRHAADLSPEEHARLGENGYRYAKAHFDRDVLAERYLGHLRRAAAL